MAASHSLRHRIVRAARGAGLVYAMACAWGPVFWLLNYRGDAWWLTPLTLAAACLAVVSWLRECDRTEQP